MMVRLLLVTIYRDVAGVVVREETLRIAVISRMEPQPSYQLLRRVGVTHAQASALLLMVYKVMAVEFPLVGLWTQVERP